MIGDDRELEALASLVRTHQADLLRVAVGMSGSGPLARDAADATWARVSRKLDALGRPSAARAILLRTVSVETQRRLHPGPVARLGTWLRPVAFAKAEPDGDERLAGALAGLETEDRLVLALHHGAARTSEEIAAQLGRSGADVRAELASLRERLIARLGVVDPYRPDADLTEVELDRRLGDRLVRLWDRAAGREEAMMTARRVLARRRERRRMPRVPRRLVLGGAAAGALLLGLAGITALVPAGAAPDSSPTPRPGSLVPLEGWSERVVAGAPEADYLVLGWAPDARHVAVLDTNDDQVTVFDRDGDEVRSFPGTDAAWLGSDQLIVLQQSGGWFPTRTLLARAIEAGPDLEGSDLLVDTPGVGSIMGNAGAVAMTVEDRYDSEGVAQPASFVVFHAGVPTDPIPGVPLAWAPDGRTLAYMDYGWGRYGGPLHLLDVVTLADRLVGTEVNNDCSASFNPAATMLLTCVPGPVNAYATDLALVKLADGSVQYSSLGGLARGAWTADGLIGVEASGAILRWRPGDMPVALRWQPDKATGITTITALGNLLALGQGDGPEVASMVAGESPPLLLIPGLKVDRGGLASPDGTHVIYARTLVPRGVELVMATLDSTITSPAPTFLPPSQQPLEVGEAVLRTPSSAVVASLAGDLNTAWGPFFYTAYPSYETFEDLRVTDVRYGSSVAIGLPVAAGEEIGWAGTDGTYLAVMLSTRGEPIDWDEDCPVGLSRPLVWRLLAARLGPNGAPSGQFVTTATGVARRIFDEGPEGCPFTMEPSVAIDGGVIAYTVEAPSSANRWASRIILQRLSDGTAIRSVVTAAPVEILWLRAGAAVWLERSDGSEAPNGSEGLFVSTSESPARHAVEVPDTSTRPDWVNVSLVGSQIVYQADYDDVDAPSAVWRIPVNGGTPERLSPADLSCSTDGEPSETVVLHCDTGGGVIPYLWTEDGALHPLDTTWWTVATSGGWMHLIGFDWTQVTAFPIEDLLR